MRYQSLDTIRVLSGVLVVLSHYSYLFEDTDLNWVSQNVAGYTGHVGVSLFFLISGFLAANSLTKDCTSQFYIKKYIRIEVPYLTSFLVMSFIFILLSVVDSRFFGQTPLSRIIVENGNYLDFVPILFAQDGILNSLGISKAFLGRWLPSFTGQWFIGTILWIYLLAPFLNLVLKKVNPWIVLVLSILVSAITYFLIADCTSRPMWFFLCRVPEFLIGMVIFNMRQVLLTNQRLYTCICLFIVLSMGAVFISFYGLLPQGNTFFPLTPRLFVITLPLLLLLFYASEYLNNKFQLIGINAYSKYLYVVMLIHQVILFRLFEYLPYKSFSIFGYFIVFLIILLISLYLSKLIVSVSKQIETALIEIFVKRTFTLYK